jgi:hypothetical protein
MQGLRRLIITAPFLLLVILGRGYFVAEAQKNQERLAFSNGQGSLRVGDQEFKINSVIVKLFEDRKAEVTLVSDITIFLTASWSTNAESKQEIDLEFSGADSRGGLEGSGKVVLANEGKSVSRLMLKGISRATKRSVEATFEGK